MELQGRQRDFQERGALLVALGSKPESMDIARRGAQARDIAYPLLYDAKTSVTRDLGLWSDHMQMPWMGYLIIDRSGRVAAVELQLSESIGAGPRNVDEILAAVDQANARKR